MPEAHPINLQLISDITDSQTNRAEHIVVDAPGTIAHRDNVTYLRYIETTETDGAPVTTKVMFKLEADNTLQMRRSGASQGQFHFIPNQTTTTHYATAAGRLLLEVTTHRLRIDQSSATSGAIDLTYELHYNGDSIGRYQITCRYQ